MANMNFGVNILPKANNTYTLGNSDYKWNIFANTLNGINLTNIITDIQIDGTSILSNNVANIPIGTWDVLGVVKPNPDYGVGRIASDNPISNGTLLVAKATSAQIKTGNNEYKPIVPYNQHESVFYGLAKAAGDSTQSASSNAIGVYTDSAKIAIKNMLAVPKIDDNEEYDLNTTWSAKRLSATTRIHSWIASNFSNGLELPTPTIIADQKIDEQGNLVSDSNYNTYVYALTLNTTLIIHTRNNEEFTWGEYSSSSISSSTLYGDITITNGYDYVQIMAPYFAFSCEKTTVNNHNVIILYMGFTGVTNTDYATAEKAGVIKIDGNGLWINSSNGKVSITKASTANIKSGTVETYPIVPYNQHEAVFYGLAKAAGDSTQASSSNAVGTYTSQAQSAIRNMLAAAPKSSPFFTGAISLGRYRNNADQSDEANTIGFYSIAVGNNIAATGESSQAFGQDTYAVGWTAHAEGRDTAAYGNMSHTEGIYTLTEDGAWASHAEGSDTIANTPCVHVSGQYNSITDLSLAPTWTANTSYTVGDIVKHEETNDDDETHNYVYRCITANNDATFDYGKWITWENVGDFAEIIGNGGYINDDPWTELRSNARALDWQGNEYLNGDLYINCNSDSTGGTSITEILDKKISITSDTITGNPCTFNSDIEDIPLKSIKLEYEFSQSGSGDPYPPGGGKNKFDKNGIITSGEYLNSDGTTTSNESWGITDYIPIKGNAVTLSGVGGSNPSVCAYDSGKNYLTGAKYNTGSWDITTNITLTSETEIAYVRLSVYNAVSEYANTIQLEAGSSATSYAPYSNVRPISGVSSLSVYRTGVNIFDEEFEEGRLSTTNGGNVSDLANIRSKNYISVVPGKQYYVKFTGISGGTNMRMFSYYADKSYKNNQWITTTTTFTVPSDVHYIRFYMDTAYSASNDRKISINYPNTETEYIPYNGTKLDVTFPTLGKNLFNAEFSRKNVDYQTGYIGGNTTRITSDFVELAPNTYTFSLKESKQLTVYFYTQPNSEGNYFVSSERISEWQSIPFTFTTTEKRYALFVLRNSDNSEILTTDVSEVMLNTGSSAFTYEPYCNTVYGGSLELTTGVLTLTHAEYETTWGAGDNSYVFTTNERRRIALPFTCINGTWDSAGVCNVASWRWSFDSDTTHFYNHQGYSYIFLPIDTDDSTEIQIVGTLANPITIQLTPQQIKTFKGTNTIWANTNGSIEIENHIDLQTIKEYADNAGIQDVQINGTSILNNKIANIPIADTTTFGVMKIGDRLGLSNDNKIYVRRATADQIKAGTTDAAMISAQYLSNATFYGLAKAAGDSTQSASSNAVGVYTDSAKTAIQNMLGITTMTGATSSVAGTAGYVPAPATTDVDKFLAGDGTYKSGGLPMVILSYGNSTWAEFEAAYNNNVIVYCRASSNANPATGSQTRMAFMAYVNNATTPTEVEFQYYRSMSSHSATAMGDQVFVYKLTKTGGWSVTTRDASIKQIKMATDSAGSVSWSSNVVTLDSGLPAVTASDNGKILKVVNGAWAVVDP